MEKVFEYEFNGHTATVIRPDKPNGKWIWKTEFLYAFDTAERTLLDMGYTRVYYSVSDRYGSFGAIRLFREFYFDVIKRFSLEEKCNLFGFSRGGLYAFNYALFYPESVKSVYLDAPVLDLTSWPPYGSIEQKQFYEEYNLNEETVKSFRDSPIHHLEEYAKKKIPTLLIAGLDDKTVPFNENGKILLDYFNKNGYIITSILKEGCDHHPHSLEDPTKIIEFLEKL